MHLLAAAAQRIDEGEAVDLALPSAPIVVLSATDSELAAFSRAARLFGVPVSLASVAQLKHPMSVDLLAERTLRHAKVIALRLLGGEAYFSYGVEVLRRVALRTGAALVIVPGEATFDPALAARGTVPEADARAFHAFCREGGPDNRGRALQLLAELGGHGPRPAPATPVPAAGLYAEGHPVARLDQLPWWGGGGATVGLVFYRAHLMDGLTRGIDALIAALCAQGLRPVPLYASSLREEAAARTIDALLQAARADVVLTTMAFSAGGPSVLDGGRRVVLTAVQASLSAPEWQASAAGLPLRDLAMSVVTPEFDGRVLTRAFAFRTAPERDAATGALTVDVAPSPDRAAFVAELAKAHATLAATPWAGKRIALVVANYPGRGGRIANGVGLDTPASTMAILRAMSQAGAEVAVPDASAALMQRLVAVRADPPERLPLAVYRAWFERLPKACRAAVLAEWGEPEDDPATTGDAIAVPVLRLGNAVVGVQPTRGYERGSDGLGEDRDPKARYHDPALVPPHAYLAFYLWMRMSFAAHAVVHVGKHGNLEWLPGKATALSAACWPELALGPMPNISPFIVNDPGEGSQAKRRTQAVIVDHLTPPMTRAEAHGAGAALEALIDEYVFARSLDPGRADRVAGEIIDLAQRHGFAADLGLDLSDLGASLSDLGASLTALDAHVCDLKEMQIRDGLHILGTSPTGRQRRDTLLAIARFPQPGVPSMLRAIAGDFSLGFDPLCADLGSPWTGPRPDELAGGVWRTTGDTVERLEAFAAALIDGEAVPGQAAAAVLEALHPVATALDDSGAREIEAVVAALEGCFVAPGPSGAPTRGRPDVLPTGRNFYSVDVRGVPTPAAWEIGRAAAERVVERYVMEEGDWPRSIVLTCWGTANMRTGGDDIAQALAFIGAAPAWEQRRLTGFTPIPLGTLMRPRVDVTLRVSGFFRDAFPEQIALFDAAARAVAALDEPDDQNPLRARFRASDVSVFGAMPGTYGAGLQALIDTGDWTSRTDLAEAFVAWGRYGYGRGREGTTEEAALRSRLAGVDAVVQAQDNREHDILDSDDYYQFEGGLAAAVEAERGRAPLSLHVDTSRPERPVARTLGEEVARVVRGRAANPKWIAGVMRHGYKGAFEIAATVDYLFAFAATTDAVHDHHFDQLYDAYLGDVTVADFIAEANAPALTEIAARFEEAIARNLWRPTRNDVRERLAELRKGE